MELSSSSKDPKRARDFDFGETIGEGAFGYVVRATEKETGRPVAIKIVDKKHVIKEGKADYIKTEKALMGLLSHHPFVVKLLFTFQDPSNLYFVMELASNGELLQVLRKMGSFDTECSIWYAAELISVCEYMHGKGVIHRDLKPENVLIGDDMHIRVTDFGTAKKMSSKEMEDATLGSSDAPRGSFVGTAEYVSPEILTNKPASPATDLWALGCIIYQMLAGRVPFKAGSEYQIFQKILNRELSFPSDFPRDAQDLIEQLLATDPTKRLGIGPNGYAKLKAHPFFRDIEWETIHKTKPPEIRPYLPSLEPNYSGADEAEFYEDADQETEDLEDLSAAAKEADDLPADPVIDNDPTIDAERKRQLKLQKQKSKWVGFLFPNELIIYSSTVLKKKGLFSKKRQLILTDFPRLIYVDIAKNEQKGEIPWSDKLRPELKNKKVFFIHTPSRTYYLEDLGGQAQKWVNTIIHTLNTKVPKLESGKYVSMARASISVSGSSPGKSRKSPSKSR